MNLFFNCILEKVDWETNFEISPNDDFIISSK